MLGALIGATGSILGGLLGGETSQRTREKTKSKSRTRSTSTSDANLGRLVRDAERNGFNPLTVLRSGGLSAYSTVNNSGYSVTKSNSRGKNNSSSSAPLGAGIAGAFQTIGGAMADSGPSPESGAAADAWQGLRYANDPVAAKSQEFDLVQAQLRDARVGAVSEDGGNPTVPASSTYYTRTPALKMSGGSDGGSMQPTFEAPTVTNPWPTRSGIKVNPNVPDVSAFEERYGESEIMSTIAGAGTLAGDIYNSLPTWKQSVADLQKDIDTVVVSPYRDLIARGNQWDVLPNVLESVTQDDVKKLQLRPSLQYVSPTGAYTGAGGGVGGW